MELFAEAISVVGALLLSVSFGLLLEELIFGGLIRLFFAPRPVCSALTSEPRERNEGERKCLR